MKTYKAGELREDMLVVPVHALEGFALVPVESAASDVLAERKRQIDAEGMSTAGDDSYQAAELPRAAAAYILSGSSEDAPYYWPWSKEWWKPRDGRKNYVRAAALLIAEIERIDRAMLAAAPKGDSHE